MTVPEELRYTDQHEWIRLDDGVARIGITDYAQDALGDVVFVEIASVGTMVAAGDAIAEVESTKSVAEVYAPVAGEIVEVNEALVANPETVNSSPFEDGWFVAIRPDDPSAIDDLLDAAAYRDLIG